MKNSQKTGGLIAMIAAALFIDFTVLFGSNLSWGPKLLLVGISALGQIVAIWGWLHMKPWPEKTQEVKEKQVYNLTMKFYNVLTLIATSIYTVGIGLSTPNTNPPFIKYIALGGLLAIQFFFLLFFSLKKIKERADERFYANLAKAASLMFVFILGALMILAVIIGYMGSLTLYMGQIFISIAALIFIFAVVYFILERRG